MATTMNLNLDIGGRKPADSLVLARHYERPDCWHGIYLPQGWRQDRTVTLWEVVQASKGAQEFLGMELATGDVFKTRPFQVQDSGLDDDEGRDLFFITAQNIFHVIPCSIPTEEVSDG